MTRTLELESASGTAVTAEGRDCDWNAVFVRPRSEKRVLTALSEKGYEVFAPFYRKKSIWSDRVKVVEAPLFPGYVFCREPNTCAPRCVTTSGVIGFVKSGERVATISEREMGAIRRIAQAHSPLEPWPYLHQGERVEIIRGPMTGIQGIVVRSLKQTRVILSIDALQRAVAIEVDQHHVAPLRYSIQ